MVVNEVIFNKINPNLPWFTYRPLKMCKLEEKIEDKKDDRNLMEATSYNEG